MLTVAGWAIEFMAHQRVALAHPPVAAGLASAGLASAGPASAGRVVAVTPQLAAAPGNAGNAE